MLARIRPAFADLLGCIPYPAGVGAVARLKDLASWLARCSEPDVSITSLRPMFISLREMLPELARQPSPPDLAPKAKVLLALVDEALAN